MENNTASIALGMADGSGLIVHFGSGSERELEVRVRQEIDKFFADRARKKKFRHGAKK